MSAAPQPVEPSVGWGVLHLYYRVDRTAAESGAAKRILDAIAALEAHDHQVLTHAVLGQKADIGFMAIGPDLARLHVFQADLAATALIPAYSYVSLTETSEYMQTEEHEEARLAREGVTDALEAEAALAAFRERIEHYLENRLHPRLPRKNVLCFYPMSKRRGADANWYALSFEERRRIMGGHGRIGRTYAGRVLQLITGSTGLDDWEWGVTLLADDPVAIKEIVYEMRFDEASTRYAEFGPFIVGLLLDHADALARVGLTA